MVAQLRVCDQFIGHDGKKYFNNVLKDFGTRECHKFREGILENYHDLAPAMRAEYLSIATN